MYTYSLLIGIEATYVFILQVIVADDVNMTRTSPSVFTSVTIQSVNDEPPVIMNTSSTVSFVEGGGPITIVGEGVIINDLDNCINHTTVVQLVVRLENPVQGEDLLIVGGEVYGNHSVTFSCDSALGANCYEDFLRTIEYNNANDEPESYSQERNISIEVNVSVASSNSLCAKH